MSIESTPGPVRLQSLQALRAVAALLVVVFHAAAIWREAVGADVFRGPWDQGWAGVDLFFVISGFVMVWVAGERPAGPRIAARFLFDRATRVYPLWWVFCAVMAGYFLWVYGQPAAPAPAAATTAGPGWLTFLRSMALWPQGQMPVLPVGWTLSYELAFYALFAALLWLPPRWRPWALGLWGAVLALRWGWGAVAPGLPHDWLGTVLDPLCLEFLFGAGVAYWLRRRALPAPAAIGALAAGTVLFAVAMTVLADTGSGLTQTARILHFGVPSALILLGAVGWERVGRARQPGWLLRIGDASYTLYLAHFILLLALKRAWIAAGWGEVTGPAAFAAFVLIGTALSVAASLLLYRALERPLLRLARAPLAKRSAARQM
ncbi:acyltransferase [uncultured Algimonas sp.]|uniref:acyltransferase family protein n=1 Tax=uncultured Algimonas sp. TaxID=1547920 RepID=UPI0026117CC8|nr:acyltransferase [uncultured Algimonas sp.]